MIAALRTTIFILAAVVLTAKGWELPAHLADSLPVPEATETFDSRSLEASSGATKSKEVLVKPLSIETEGPTESPAPSPSPSESPTLSPTVTDQPTGKPTSAPTESPAPSPSPSETPTSAPSDSPSVTPTNRPTVSSPPSNVPSVSPSDHPSLTPSALPSAEPTVSAQPSSSPSQEPTAFPSAQPTVSAQPSSSPSAAPTVSMQPSSSPTLITQVAAIFTVVLRLESGLLTDAQISAFENATVSFLQTDVTLDSGKIEDIVVDVAGQTVIDVSNVTTTGNSTSNSTKRALQNISPFFLEQALEVIFSVKATYTGSDPGLSLHDALMGYFENPESRWFRWLGASNAVFEPVAPELTPEERAVAAAAAAANAEYEGTKKRGNGAVWLATLLAIMALVLGIAASVFSVRHYRRHIFGQELASPRLGSTSSGLGSRIANENLQYEYSQQMESETPVKRTTSDEDAGVEVDSATSSWMKPTPSSPNSLENGNGVAIDQIMQTKRSYEQPLDDRWSHIQQSNSNTSRTSKDPPTNRTEVNFPTMPTDPRNMTSLFDNNTVMSDMTRSHLMPQTIEEGPPTGRSSSAGSTFGASEFSNHAKSFFAGLVSGPGTPRRSRGKKGDEVKHEKKDSKTRTVTPTEEIEVPDQMSYDSMTNRAGLYDVFAPPGAIGIVVDTTKHGPAVHALKRNSPMLGLINPGDLIVGLDDEDARGMTAATLTRLMAAKSNQKERKITLLTSADNF